MPNLIEGDIGQLGTGKTLRCVIKSYSSFCNNREICSNLPLEFKHTPIRNIEDFLNLSHCDLLGDELWAIGDNRKRNDLGEIATLFCLRSRKQDVNIRYTMQFLQIDVRIAFITTLWVKPRCYPYNPNPEATWQPTPEIIHCKRWNTELEPLQDEIITNVKQYLCLYDTHKDPYFVDDLMNRTLVKKVKKELKDSLTDEDLAKYEKIKNKRGLKKLDF